jgi:hypothetical protein
VELPFSGNGNLYQVRTTVLDQVHFNLFLGTQAGNDSKAHS